MKKTIDSGIRISVFSRAVIRQRQSGMMLFDAYVGNETQIFEMTPQEIEDMAFSIRNEEDLKRYATTFYLAKITLWFEQYKPPGDGIGLYWKKDKSYWAAQLHTYPSNNVKDYASPILGGRDEVGYYCAKVLSAGFSGVGSETASREFLLQTLEALAKINPKIQLPRSKMQRFLASLKEALIKFKTQST